jgi:hypothetical protein
MVRLVSSSTAMMPGGDRSSMRSQTTCQYLNFFSLHFFCPSIVFLLRQHLTLTDKLLALKQKTANRKSLFLVVEIVYLFPLYSLLNVLILKNIKNSCIILSVIRIISWTFSSVRLFIAQYRYN